MLCAALRTFPHGRRFLYNSPMGACLGCCKGRFGRYAWHWASDLDTIDFPVPFSIFPLTTPPSNNYYLLLVTGGETTLLIYRWWREFLDRHVPRGEIRVLSFQFNDSDGRCVFSRRIFVCAEFPSRKSAPNKAKQPPKLLQNP